MPLICEQLPNSFSEVIGSKVLHLHVFHSHAKTTKDIFYSLLCVRVQPPHPPTYPPTPPPPSFPLPKGSCRRQYHALHLDKTKVRHLLFYVMKLIKQQMAFNFCKETTGKVVCFLFFTLARPVWGFHTGA